jgi:hypothetical protein
MTLWGVSGPSYKGRARRESLPAALERLRAATLWLRWSSESLSLCAASDHAFDAVVAALAARAVALGQATRPTTPLEIARAPAEGWMALPTGRLTDLAQS